LHRSAVLLAALVCAALLAPGAASADVTLSNVVARPIPATSTCAADKTLAVDAPAGGHSDLCVAFDVSSPGNSDDLKDLTLHLAPGLLGDPNGAAKCTADQFGSDTCPADSQVGTVANTAIVSSLPLPQQLTGEVYNLVPQGQEPARLGIKVDGTVLSSAIHLATTIAIRTTDYGLDSVTHGIPRQASIPPLGLPADIQITKMALTLWGRNDVAGRTMAKPFVTLPTSCRPATNTVDATAYNGAGSSASDTFTPTACDRQPYAPKFSATLGEPGQTSAGDHVQVDTLITQTTGEANTARTVVTLPAGFGADQTALARACPEEQLLKGACPASAKVGMVAATSPVLPFPLNGDILIVQPKGGILPELSLELPLGIRLRATVGFAAGGRLQTVFPVIPDVPLDRLRVVLLGGKGGMLVAGSDLCRIAPPLIDTEFTSQGGAVRTASTPATIPCTPKLAASARVAGVRKRRPTASLTVAASGTTLRQVTVTLPKQLRAASAKALRRGARVRADGRPATLRLSKGRLVVAGLPQGGARTVQITLRRGALRLRGNVKPGRRLAFGVSAVRSTGEPLRAGATAKAAK
jgi:hypothetical protein